MKRTLIFDDSLTVRLYDCERNDGSTYCMTVVVIDGHEYLCSFEPALYNAIALYDLRRQCGFYDDCKELTPKYGI